MDKDHISNKNIQSFENSLLLQAYMGYFLSMYTRLHSKFLIQLNNDYLHHSKRSDVQTNPVPTLGKQEGRDESAS